MSRFDYYIVDPEENTVVGTDNEELAGQYAEEGSIVIDAKKGKAMSTTTEVVEEDIEEAVTPD